MEAPDPAWLDALLGETDGVAWAIRTPGEQVESFVFGRMLDRIAAGHALSADGSTRTDVKLNSRDIPMRIRAMLEEYAMMGLRQHQKKQADRELSEAELSSMTTSSGARPKLPLNPTLPPRGQARGARVVPVAAAAAR